LNCSLTPILLFQFTLGVTLLLSDEDLTLRIHALVCMHLRRPLLPFRDVLKRTG